MLGAGGIAAAAATRGLSDRPLDPFGCASMFIDFYRGKPSLSAAATERANQHARIA